MNGPTWRHRGPRALPDPARRRAGIVGEPALPALGAPAPDGGSSPRPPSAGVLLALAALILLSGPTTASSTVLLTHSATDDPLTAIQSDESLLGTRTVLGIGRQATRAPHLARALRSTFTSSSQLSTELIEIDLQAPTAQEAMTRLNALASDFPGVPQRAAEEGDRNTIQANDDQISSFRRRRRAVTKQYNISARRGSRPSWLRTSSARKSQHSTRSPPCRARTRPTRCRWTR